MIGLYRDPPEKSLVLCGDEKTQCEALERTQSSPSLGRKDTHVEWLRFLKRLERETHKDLDLRLIADNYATHKQTKVKAWRGAPGSTSIARRPRVRG